MKHEPILRSVGGDGSYVRTYTGFLPTKEQMSERGWEFDWMGAEGPRYKKGEYRLQIVQQGEESRSVINHNNEIKGWHQNLHIFKDNARLNYYGRVNTIEQFDAACASQGIPLTIK